MKKSIDGEIALGQTSSNYNFLDQLEETLRLIKARPSQSKKAQRKKSENRPEIFVVQRKQKKKVENYIVNIDNFMKERRRDQSVRIDVILKSILRKMRKFYTKRFNDMTAYKLRKRYRIK